jgi:hypothetical protein
LAHHQKLTMLQKVWGSRAWCFILSWRVTVPGEVCHTLCECVTNQIVRQKANHQGFGRLRQLNLLYRYRYRRHWTYQVSLLFPAWPWMYCCENSKRSNVS